MEKFSSLIRDFSLFPSIDESVNFLNSHARLKKKKIIIKVHPSCLSVFVLSKQGKDREGRRVIFFRVSISGFHGCFGAKRQREEEKTRVRPDIDGEEIRAGLRRERERERKKERERDERVGVSSSKVLIPERGAWGSGRQRPRERRWEKIGGNREREYFG